MPTSPYLNKAPGPQPAPVKAARRQPPALSFGQRVKRTFRRLHRAFNPSPRIFRFDDELLGALGELAEREGTTEEALAAELLRLALAQRNAAEAQLLRWRALTPREQQVVALVCLNYTNEQIAARLVISPETVKTHVRNVLWKLDLRSKADLRQALADWDFSAYQDAKL